MTFRYQAYPIKSSGIKLRWRRNVASLIPGTCCGSTVYVRRSDAQAGQRCARFVRIGCSAPSLCTVCTAAQCTLPQCTACTLTRLFTCWQCSHGSSCSHACTANTIHAWLSPFTGHLRYAPRTQHLPSVTYLGQSAVAAVQSSE